MLALRRPNDRLILLNAGISAQTSSDIFARFLNVVHEQPAWILCPMGANDTWYWTNAPLKLNVSLEETEKNLLAMRQAAATLNTSALGMVHAATVHPGASHDALVSGYL